MINEKALQDIKNVVNSDVDVPLDVIKEFHLFVVEKLFNDIPSNLNYTLGAAYTTLSFLNMKYFIEAKNVDLTFILKGSKGINNDSIYTDYFHCSFAFLDKKTGQVKGSVRVFEDSFDNFRQIFYSLIRKLETEYN